MGDKITVAMLLTYGLSSKHTRELVCPSRHSSKFLYCCSHVTLSVPPAIPSLD